MSYYVMVDGKKHVWNPGVHWFLPQGETFTVRNGVPDKGVSPEDVDMNGYTL